MHKYFKEVNETEGIVGLCSLTYKHEDQLIEYHVSCSNKSIEISEIEYSILRKKWNEIKAKVVIKKINDRAYELIECTESIKDDVWGHCIDLTEHPSELNTGVKIFHSTWLEKLQKACEAHNVELAYQ